MKQPFTLAVDIGTSSVRAGLYDGAAHPVARSSVKIDSYVSVTSDGSAELDAEAAFSQVALAVDSVLEKTKHLKIEIGLVAICSYWHSLVGVDAKGRPTTGVFLWADTRSRKYTSVLRKRFNERDTHDRTGAHFHSSYWPARLLWLRKEYPEAFDRTDRWLSFSDYVLLKLFGAPVTSVSMASGTGLFDIHKCAWDSELSRFLKVKPARLPAISVDDFSTAKLRAAYVRRWPRLTNARWLLPVGDGAADNIGAGCSQKGTAALMIGTSGAMRVAYTGEPPRQLPDGLWCYRINRDRVVLGGALSDGGALHQWLRSNLDVPSNAEDEMRRRGAAAHGLTFLPFLGGERSTGYNDDAAGSILGLTSSHDSTDILQAGLESVAFRFAEIFDRLRSVERIDKIVASGGALRESPVWPQIIADVLGRDLILSGVPESSSRGVVLLALESIGKIETIDNIPLISDDTVAYHPECHAIYKNARKQHQTAYLRSFRPK